MVLGLKIQGKVIYLSLTKLPKIKTAAIWCWHLATELKWQIQEIQVYQKYG